MAGSDVSSRTTRFRPTAATLFQGRRLTLGERTLLMGVVNVTPDSFYAKSRTPTAEPAVERALTQIEQGADIIDVGGESTRPGSEPVEAGVEIERVLPVIERVRKLSDVAISVDTQKAAVARAALSAGADIVNDVSALTADPDMASLVAETGAIAVLMHMRGRPDTMQNEAHYEDVVLAVKAELGARIATATRAGIARERLWLDPGLGFAKTARHNVELLNRLGEFLVFELPLVVGASRKSFIGHLTDAPDPQQRLEGSLAVAAIAALKGAHIVRTHDVAETARALRVADAIREPALLNE